MKELVEVIAKSLVENPDEVVVTETESGLWTDGRYFIQAESELAGSEVQLFKMGQSGVPTITEYLANTLQEGSCVGFDGKVLAA